MNPQDYFVSDEEDDDDNDSDDQNDDINQPDTFGSALIQPQNDSSLKQQSLMVQPQNQQETIPPQSIEEEVEEGGDVLEQ